MGHKREPLVLVGDFETTVYEGQTDTAVWASALVPLNTEDVTIDHSIGETFQRLRDYNRDLIVYYHNLKFDGSFWLSYLLVDLKYQHAASKVNPNADDIKWHEDKEMSNATIKYSISDMGQWYNIKIKVDGHMIEIRDSLKLLPFSVKRIGKSFKTKHKKLEMEYKGFRYPGCVITEEEQKYIANDVLVVKEALEIMFEEGHKKLTIGSCCLAEFKHTHMEDELKQWLPNLYDEHLNENTHGYKTAGEWIHRSYKGGWCYLVKGKENQVKHNGTTADVNSLYPSMMHSESGNYYPVGKPTWWTGDYIPSEATYKGRYYFVRIRTRFYLKPGKLPFVQIKNNHLYKSTECLTTSDVYDAKTDAYYDSYRSTGGVVKPAIVELTLTMTDWQLLQDHYELVDCQILDGCYFYAEIGLFDEYIDTYRKQKQTSTGARRELAKLFLNNLYGKMASSTCSSFKVAFVKEDGSLGFRTVVEYDKEPGYIPIGSAITSYARNFTIRAAQMNYHGLDKPGFIYADTDSIHCDLPPEEIKGIKVHDTAFCCWKLESCWDIGYFSRQKTYIEHVTHDNLKLIEPYYNVKCAGMPESCKDLFVKSMTGYEPQPTDNYTDEQREFLSRKRTLEDFTTGLRVPGKLRPARIPGGVLLVETSYEMR